MFNNIGGKIKTLAEFSCWIGIIASIIGGLILMNNGMTVSGFITIAVGSLVSWIGSFFTYGFGQLIENSDKIANTMDCVKNEDEIEFAHCPKCKMKTYIENGKCGFCGHEFYGE